MNKIDPTGLAPWDDKCIRGVNCPWSTPSVLQSWGDDHPEAAQHIVNFAGGVLDVNPITTRLPLNLEGHGVERCSGWYRSGQGSMFAVDLWAGVGQQAARLRDSATLGGSSRLFGRGAGLLNSNNVVRAGWGWKGSHATGQDVFRLVVGNKDGPIHWHLDVWEVGRALFR